MKRQRRQMIFIVLVVLCIIACVWFYLYDVIWCKTPVQDNLFRALAVVFMLLGTLVRLYKSGGRKGLDVYEKAYASEIGSAFQNKPLMRKKLLCACRLYDESNYRKALKYLFELLRETEFSRDAVPVYLFIALCYSDAGHAEEAIKSYYKLLEADPNHAQAHSNLGGQLIQVGDFDAALQHYNKSIELKPENYYAYVSRANYYFRISDYDRAIEDGVQALQFKNNGVEAASLLTIIYALQDDPENRKKYYHLAISSGKRPEDLDEAIAYFQSENKITEEK